MSKPRDEGWDAAQCKVLAHHVQGPGIDPSPEKINHDGYLEQMRFCQLLCF